MMKPSPCWPTTTRSNRPRGPRRYTAPMTRRHRLLPSLLRSAVAVSLVLPSAALVLSGTELLAQRGAANRVVSGKVIDKGNAAMKGAVVYLKDDHTLAIKSYIADDQGEYRFGQLAQATDYELWAELNGKKSATKTISSFDNKNAFTIDLKIDTSK